MVFAVAQRTLADAASFMQVADSTLRSIDSTLQRMRELAVQTNSGTYSAAQKNYDGQRVLLRLKLRVGAIQTRATFNGTAIFGGGALTIQAGANKTDTITTTAVATFAPTALVTDIATLDADLVSVATALSTIGADASSIDRAMDGAMAMEDGQRAAYSRSMDADFCHEQP